MHTLEIKSSGEWFRGFEVFLFRKKSKEFVSRVMTAAYTVFKKMSALRGVAPFLYA